MRIGINVSRLSGQRLGVGRYLEYMLKYWSQMLGPGEEVDAYLREAVPAETLTHLNLSPSSDGFQVHVPHRPSSDLSRIGDLVSSVQLWPYAK